MLISYSLSPLKVLSAGDNEVGLEQLEEDADDIALQKARRSAGSMSAMSGANGRVYMEYRYASCYLAVLVVKYVVLYLTSFVS